jgi:hypothetical protein
VAKETSAAMTKVAKAKVTEFREVARREQADSSLDGPKTGKKKKVEKGQGQTKKTPKAIATVSKPNAKSKDTSPPPTDENEVSAGYFQIGARHSPIHLQLGAEDATASHGGPEPGDEAMMVDEHEPQDPPTLDENFQPPADFRDRKSRLTAVFQRNQQSMGKPKPGSR